MKPVIFNQKVIEAIVNEDEYINVLSEELMLDEVLCGECDPKEFLKQTMKQTFVEYRKKKMLKAAEQRRIDLEDWANN